MERCNTIQRINLKRLEGCYIMDQLLQQLANLGGMGIVAALLCYDVFYLQKKLISVIEANTRAMQELKSYCSNKKESML